MEHTLIYPSVLAIKDDPSSWDSRIAKLPIPLAGIHYDIGDGDFVSSKMLDAADIALIQWDLPIDVHLMVRRPSSYFPHILSFPPVTAVAFHIECDEDIHETITLLRNAGKKVGLALLSGTPTDYLDPYLLEIDYVLLMTVAGGYSWTPFLPETLPKISEIHHKMPELPIIVDGGIGEKTFPLCIQAGAQGAVMSSALFGGGSLDWLT